MLFYSKYLFKQIILKNERYLHIINRVLSKSFPGFLPVFVNLVSPYTFAYPKKNIF